MIKTLLPLFALLAIPAITLAAVTPTALETTGNNTDQTSYSTGSITPTGDRLILACVYTIAAAAPNTPTASGNGLTWVEVNSTTDDLANRRATLFRALGSSPSTGAITFDFAGQTQSGAAWSVIEYSNIDTSGTNGSGAIIQSVADGSGANATSFTVNLSAFASPTNATYGCFGLPLNTANQPTEGSGFTRTGQRNQGTPNLSIGTEFLATADTSVDMSSGVGNVPWAGIAVEIQEAAVPVPTVQPRLIVAQGQMILTQGQVIIQ